MKSWMPCTNKNTSWCFAATVFNVRDRHKHRIIRDGHAKVNATEQAASADLGFPD